MSQRPTYFDTPEALARAFFSALDGRRWREAAALIHPETAERFRSHQVERIREEERSEASRQRAETIFTPAASLVGVATAAEAEALPATELLARFAEALDPAAVLRRVDGPGASPRLQLRRTVLTRSPAGAGRARVEYRTEWLDGEHRHHAMSGVHVLTAAWTDEGWRVRDVDLGGRGEGHILPPDQHFSGSDDPNARDPRH